MNIILLRHGTRDYGIGDSPLNNEGLDEAKELADQSRLLLARRLLASPKKRAQMTLEPLSKKLKLEIEVCDWLDQQQNNEGRLDFEHRVEEATARLPQMVAPGETVVVCSHSDWLTVALEKIPTDLINASDLFFHCADYMTFSLRDGIWHRI